MINNSILSNEFEVKIPLSLHILQCTSFLKAAKVDAVSPTAVSASTLETIISGSELYAIDLSGFLEACVINFCLSVFHFTFIVYIFIFLSVLGDIVIASVMGGLAGFLPWVYEVN